MTHGYMSADLMPPSPLFTVAFLNIIVDIKEYECGTMRVITLEE